MNTLMFLFHFALVTTIYGQTNNTAGTADPVTVSANHTAVSPESHSMTSRPTAYSTDPVTVSANHTAVSPESHSMTSHPTAYSTDPVTVSANHTAVSPESHSMTSHPTAYSTDPVTVSANHTAVSPESHSMTSHPTDSITTESRSSPSASTPVVNDTSTTPDHFYNVNDPGSPNNTSATPTPTEETSSVPGLNISSTIQPNGTEPTSDINNTSSTETLTSSPTGYSEHTTATKDSISTSEMSTALDSSTHSTISSTFTDLTEPSGTDFISSTEFFTVSDSSISTRDGTSTPSPTVTKTISITAPTQVHYTTTPPGLCSSNPCPSESICVDLFENFTCQCPSGMLYTGSSCIIAKVFPGILHLSLDFDNRMSDTKSEKFKEMAKLISETMAKVLNNNNGYIESKVISLKEGSIIANLENIFDYSSSITEKEILKEIDSAIKKNDYPLQNANFSATSACDSAPPYCASNTADCQFDNGIVSCPCLDEYVPFLFSPRNCIACPSGQKAKNGKCVSCPFGYSGFNCSDSSLLAVVVISCVLGGLLLFTLLTLLIICCRTTSKGHNYGSPYSSPNAAEPWPNQGVPKIPRANTNNHWERPEMEMKENGNARPMAGREQVPSRRGYYDDLKNFAGRNTSKYSHLVQGQENPYFVHEDEDGK
ncbi:protein HEG homolog 1-like isoform X4 [Brienomyrus brachyistius]|uniref:protein HEG homolog 1-like isoform X4 n=1 Tax=Brienomyrus brachyistius TaxID=42636 RepID=UPI0020B2A72E|nr:protein HEG homolog 1-like isoform X4 [Brienomyrus brachyistius]